MKPTSPETAGRLGGSPECGRPDLAGRLASGEEVSGSFGKEIVAHAAACPACTVRLSLLQQAERWLSEQATSNRGRMVVTTPCPSAEDLFDFGRGLGARALTLAVERRVEAHLVDCEDCRGLVATLASRPPAPLLRGAPENLPHSTRPQAVPLPQLAPPLVKRPAARRRWMELAAAAAVLIGLLYWWDSSRASHGQERGDLAQNTGRSDAITYPKAQLLRGDSSSALCFPRARVLAASPAGTPGTWHALRFVIAAYPHAEGYRVVVSRAPKGVFGLEEDFLTLESAQPEIDAATTALAAGKYTWEAWASVNGLEHSLGRRDFEVIEIPAAREAIAERMQLSEPDRSSVILQWLVDNGFTTDARAYASGLTSSPDRDKFLSAVPGR